MDTPPLPKSGAASPRPPAHNGPGARDGARGSRRGAPTSGSPHSGDTPSPRTPHPATDPSLRGWPAHTARASAPDTRVSLVVPLGCLPCLCPFMGNPISGATNLPPVTVTMARYAVLPKSQDPATVSARTPSQRGKTLLNHNCATGRRSSRSCRVRCGPIFPARAVVQRATAESAAVITNVTETYTCFKRSDPKVSGRCARPLKPECERVGLTHATLLDPDPRACDTWRANRPFHGEIFDESLHRCAVSPSAPLVAGV